MTALTAREAQLLEQVRATLISRGQSPNHGDVARALADHGVVLGRTSMGQLVTLIRAGLLGTGVLQPLLDDPDVTDVLVNGTDGVWVDRGDGAQLTPVRLGSVAEIRDLAIRLAAAGGRRLDDAQPTVDARLPDGTRLHAVLPPVAPFGPIISLRSLRSTAFTLRELIERAMIPEELAQVLRAIMDRRAAFLISGGTGTGKTTLLASMLSLASARERIVLVEEAGELQPNHPHLVRLGCRRANAEGAGEVTLRDLVRESLRMRPDRVVVGECRGAEVVDMLTALNTGHEGGCATLHANATTHVPQRLEALCALAGMPREAVAAQASSAISLLIHLRRDGAARRIAEIAVLERGEDGMLTTRVALAWDGGGEPIRLGPAWPEVSELIS